MQLLERFNQAEVPFVRDLVRGLDDHEAWLIGEWLTRCYALLAQRVRQETAGDRTRLPTFWARVVELCERRLDARQLWQALEAELQRLPPNVRGGTRKVLRSAVELWAERRQTPLERIARHGRERARLWRHRLTVDPPDLFAAIRADSQAQHALRSAVGVAVEPWRDPSKLCTRRLRRLERQLAALWRRPVRRCAAPACSVPGGRWFVGRSRECSDCQRQGSRTTRYRERLRAATGVQRCGAMTGAGVPCSKRTLPGKRACWQHAG